MNFKIVNIRTSYLLIFFGILFSVLSCSKQTHSEIQLEQRYIEGNIIDKFGIEASHAEVTLMGTDLKTITDEKGYFKLILPKKIKEQKHQIEVFDINGNIQRFTVYEGKMNKLEYSYYELIEN